MKTQSLLVALTVVNAVMMTAILVRPQPSVAESSNQILRGRGLQIVDEQGRVRASITHFPADPNVKMPDGSKGYPETMLFRLIDSAGRPSIKIEASDDGGGLSMTEAKGNAYMNVIVKKGSPTMKLVSGAGRENVVTPQGGAVTP
ncbi:hypothetical protein BH11PSE2_BH11PSE2_22130 [soil metagenome]